MEITSENFEANFPLIKESIETCEFLSIDTEFSGHSIKMDDKPHDYETVEERYQKMKYTVTKFLAFQIGICTFHWSYQEKKYLCRPFNFYVFPKSKVKDSTHLIQASAIAFLNNNKFDFNKLFSKPLSFCQLTNQKEIQKLCKLKASKSQRSNRFISQLTEMHAKELDQILKEIDEWTFDSSSGDKLYYEIGSLNLRKQLKKQVDKRFNKKGVFVDYERYSTKTTIRKSKNFKQRNFIKGLGNIPESQDLSRLVLGFQDDDIIINKEKLLKKNKALRKEKEQVLLEEESKSQPQEFQSQYTQTQTYTQYEDGPITESQIEEEYQQLCNQEVGFTRVIDVIFKAQKTIVGHNMMFDMCFIFNQFIADLPDTFELFSHMWKLFFPQVYDTKVLSESTRSFPKTELQLVFYKCIKDKKFSNNLEIKYDTDEDEQFGKYGYGEDILKNNQGHDAGFDAYMTGHIFLSVAKYIEIGKILQTSDDIKMHQSQQAIKEDIKAGKSRSKKGSVTPTKRSASKSAGKSQPNQTKEESKKQGKKTPINKEKESTEINIRLEDLLSDFDNRKPNNGKQSVVIRPKKLENQNTLISTDIQQRLERQQCLSPKAKRVKHYFEVQNKPVYYYDLQQYSNKVMLNREIPRYFPFDNKQTQDEIDYEQKMHEQVLYLEFKEETSMMELAQIFSCYGDVNVVKCSATQGYVEFTFIDSNKIKGEDLQGVIEQVRKLMKTKLKNIILKIDFYEQANRFSEQNMQNVVISTERDI